MKNLILNNLDYFNIFHLSVCKKHTKNVIQNYETKKGLFLKKYNFFYYLIAYYFFVVKAKKITKNKYFKSKITIFNWLSN